MIKNWFDYWRKKKTVIMITKSNINVQSFCLFEQFANNELWDIMCRKFEKCKFKFSIDLRACFGSSYPEKLHKA